MWCIRFVHESFNWNLTHTERWWNLSKVKTLSLDQFSHLCWNWKQQNTIYHTLFFIRSLLYKTETSDYKKIKELQTWTGIKLRNWYIKNNEKWTDGQKMNSNFAFVQSWKIFLHLSFSLLYLFSRGGEGILHSSQRSSRCFQPRGGLRILKSVKNAIKEFARNFEG